MADVTSAIRNTVPITLFNRGLAGKIFEEVKQQGSKVVMKNNTPECVLLSPEEYLHHRRSKRRKACCSGGRTNAAF